LDPSAGLRSPGRLFSALTLSGLTGVTQMLQRPLTGEQAERVKETLGFSGTDLIRVRATKPDYEVGSSRQLLRRPVPGKPQVDAAAVKLWTLSANDMNDVDVDLLDSDDLLDQDDLKKPLPSTLRSSGCGESTDKKRKACKNWGIGIGGGTSCDSFLFQCYLGDAFRCASCPYLGMPAFSPGEKVMLNPGRLQDS
ncbi:PREDICTED: anamorsin, partial [Nanorana parkeri]|uniref:anamorsin n=1 Tax=Nanorana parkeri TaxID=125878 RepID=UPI0008546DD5